MLGLVRSEFTRITHRPLLLLPISAAAFFIILPVIFFLLSRYNSSYLPYLHGYTEFPSGPFALIRGALFVLPVALSAVVAAATAEDYSSGYLKIVLPRLPSRQDIITGKLASMTALSLAFFLIVSVGAFVASAAIRADIRFTEAALLDVTKLLLFLAVQAVYITVLSVASATLLRTPAASVVLAIIAPHLMRALTFLPGGSWLPAVHLDVLEMTLVPGSRFSSDEIASVLGASPSLITSAAAVFVFCVVVVAATSLTLARRDIR